MIVFVHKAHETLLGHQHPNLGRLLSPRQFSRAADTLAAGIPVAADNDCFQGLDEVAYTAMLDALAGTPGWTFVVVPDVVADAWETAELFELWAPAVIRRGLPVALVAQDGLEDMPRWLAAQWHRIDALFIGGSTEWKLSDHAHRLVLEARGRGKWTHMGRVNSERRMRLAKSWGVDSVDGTSVSAFTRTHLPTRLGQARAPRQTTWDPA